MLGYILMGIPLSGLRQIRFLKYFFQFIPSFRLLFLHQVLSIFHLNVLEPGANDTSWMNTPWCSLEKPKDEQIDNFTEKDENGRCYNDAQLSSD